MCTKALVNDKQYIQKARFNKKTVWPLCMNKGHKD